MLMDIIINLHLKKHVIEVVNNQDSVTLLQFLGKNYERNWTIQIIR